MNAVTDGRIALCLHCNEEIEYMEGIGWAETRIGGHYDLCPFSLEGFDGPHQPAS
jgi:hypothetical protein